MTVSLYVADHTVQFRIVFGHGTIEIQTQRLAHIGHVIFAVDLLLRRQPLGFDGEAEYCQADCGPDLRS